MRDRHRSPDEAGAQTGQRSAGVPRLRGRGGRGAGHRNHPRVLPGRGGRHRRGDRGYHALPPRRGRRSWVFRRARPGCTWTSTATTPPKSSPRPTGCWLASARTGASSTGRPVPDPAERASLWRVREDGAGLSSRLSTGGESWPGWEDSAVAPENLADYLADFRGLLDSYGLQGVMYGHFGAGCMHIRITYDLRTRGGPRRVPPVLGRRRAAGRAARRLALRRARRRPGPVRSCCR